MGNTFKVDDKVILNDFAINTGINIYGRKGKIQHDKVYFVIQEITNSDCQVRVYSKISNTHLSNQFYSYKYLKYYLEDFDENLIDNIIINLNKLEDEF